MLTRSLWFFRSSGVLLHKDALDPESTIDAVRDRMKSHLKGRDVPPEVRKEWKAAMSHGERSRSH